MAVIPEDSSASDIEPQVDRQAFVPSAEDHVIVNRNSNDAIPSLRRQDQMHTSPDKPHGVATGCLPAHVLVAIRALANVLGRSTTAVAKSLTRELPGKPPRHEIFPLPRPDECMVQAYLPVRHNREPLA